ncbi:MAG: GNAT family N-acetyltransferase [Balneolaceae bacterium]
MNIEHEESETKGAFFIKDASTKIAEITYSKAGASRIIIDHTEVSDDHRGEGLGKILVAHTAKFAHEHTLEIIPLCPYAKAVLARNPEMLNPK